MALWIWLGLLGGAIQLCGGYVSPQVPLSQVEALQDLYDSTNGECWTWREPESEYGKVWNFSTSVVNPCDNWQGVFCQSSAVNAGMLDIANITLVAYNLTGSLPTSISNISQLNTLIVKFNSIEGSMPETVCGLAVLSMLSMQDNLFSGTIPPCLHTNISTLAYLSFEKNSLHGTLPPFSNLSFLTYLSYSQNYLSGTLPPSLYSLHLTALYVSYNGFSGTLGETDSWSAMQSISVSNNYFTGTLPASFNSFSIAHSVYFEVNLLTGTLPFLGDLSSVGYASFYTNQFTGPFPTYFSNWSSVSVLELDTNYLEGSIPNIFQSISEILQLTLYDNLFTGELPASIGTLPNLAIFLLQNNRFSGDLSSVFTSSSPMMFEVLDLASNPFTGAIPDVFFSPSLLTFSTYQNCFSKRLPASLCDATNVQTLLLDGLNSWCGADIWPGIPGSPIFTKSIPGTIPSCLFALRNLTTLHLSGNGLSGTIPSQPDGYHKLRYLDVSYNSLSGSIPTSLQQWTLLEDLNLQSNKLVGTIEYMDSLNVTSPSFSISLCTNRLSGKIPISLGSAINVDILEGNLFSCSWGHKPPANDPHADDFICGSSLVDDSLLAFLLVDGVVLVILLFAAYSWTRAWARKKQDGDAVKSRSARGLPEAKQPSSKFPSDEGSTPMISTSSLGSDQPSSIQSNRPFSSEAPQRDEKGGQEGESSHPGGGSSGAVPTPVLSSPLSVMHAMWQLIRHCDHDDIAHAHAVFLRDHPQLTSSSTDSPSLFSSLESSLRSLQLTCLKVLLYHSKLSHVVAQARHHPQLSNLVQFVVSMKTLSRLAVVLMLLLVSVALPLFVLLKSYYRTYTLQYRWEYSALFLSGQVPSGVLMILWAGLLSLTLFQIVSNIQGVEGGEQQGGESVVEKGEGEAARCADPPRRARTSTLVAIPPEELTGAAAPESSPSSRLISSQGSQKSVSRHSLHTRTSSIVTRSWRKVTHQAIEALTTARKRSFWTAVTTLIFSTIVVIAIKGSFIFVLITAHVPFLIKLVLEISVGSLDIVISAALVPYLINHVPSLTSISKLFLKLSLLIVNSMLTSSVAIMVADTSCFQSIFFPIKTVSESVSYSVCGPTSVSGSLVAPGRSFRSPDVLSSLPFDWPVERHGSSHASYGHVHPGAYHSHSSRGHGTVGSTQEKRLSLLSEQDRHLSGWGETGWIHLRRQKSADEEQDDSGDASDSCPFPGETPETSSLSASYTPSFSYTYNCYSAVGRGYIPIYFIIYTLLSVAIPGGMLILARSSTRLRSVHALFPGILFVDGDEPSRTSSAEQEVSTTHHQRNPIHGHDVAGNTSPSLSDSSAWTVSTTSVSTTEASRHLLFPAFIMASAVNHILVMLTFGLLFPLLAISAAMVVCITNFSWEVIIGRWLWLTMRSSRNSSGRSAPSTSSASSSFSAQNCVCPQTLKLDAVCAQVCRGPRLCLGIVSFSSAAFIGLAAMDMAGDQVGWRDALYAPLACFSFALAAWLFFNRTKVAHVYHSQTVRFSETVEHWRESWRAPSVAAGPEFWVNRLTRTNTWQEKGVGQQTSSGPLRTDGVEMRTSSISISTARPPH